MKSEVRIIDIEAAKALLMESPEYQTCVETFNRRVKFAAQNGKRYFELGVEDIPNFYNYKGMFEDAGYIIRPRPTTRLSPINKWQVIF